MQSRCCCPPESESALAPSRSFTSSQSAAWRSVRSTISAWSPGTPVQLQAGRDVVADGHGGEGIGPLEDHAHPAPQGDGVDVPPEQVLPVDAEGALGPRAGNELVHAVQAAQEGGLPAPRRADGRRHRPGRDDEVHVVQGVVLPVPGIQVLDGQLGLDRRGLLTGRRPRPVRFGGDLGGEGWRRFHRGDLLVDVHLGAPCSRLRERNRAARLSSPTSRRSTRAAAQAFSCQSSYGLMA